MDLLLGFYRRSREREQPDKYESIYITSVGVYALDIFDPVNSLSETEPDGDAGTYGGSIVDKWASCCTSQNTPTPTASVARYDTVCGLG